MNIVRKTTATGALRRLAFLAGAAACTAAIGTLALAGTASASQYGPNYWITSSYAGLNAENSALAIDVSGDSGAPGAPIIQWYDNGGTNQHWAYAGGQYSIGPIQNENSGMCITTDGVAGDQLFQMPCVGSETQEWTVQRSTNALGMPTASFYNPYVGLEIDVYGASQWAGAAIDAWYPNGQDNQAFVVVPD